MSLNRFVLSLAASVAALTMASAASAATYINMGPVGEDGGFTLTFGNTGITTTAIDDQFDFTLPTGTADFVVTSTMSTSSQNITWSSVAFNGIEFTPMVVGQNEFRLLNDVAVSAGTIQTLRLTGVGGGNASYSGVVTFAPSMAAVPEPATWALMISGFAGAGAMLRRRQRATVTA